MSTMRLAGLHEILDGLPGSDRLRRREVELDSAVGATLARPDDPERWDELNTCLWSVIAAWARAHSTQDAKCPRDQVGSWELDPVERRVVQAGFVSEDLYRGELDPVALCALLDPAFAAERTSDDRFEIVTFLAYLRERYRTRLGLGMRSAPPTCAERLEVEESTLAELQSAQLELLEKEASLESIQRNQVSWEILLPELARVTRESRSGPVEAETRLEHRRIFETARRHVLEITQAMTAVGRRREYEQLALKIVEQMIRVMTARSAASARNEDHRTEAECWRALEKALEDCRRAMVAVAETDHDAAPPCVLVQTPRLLPATIAEQLERIFKACPRLAEAYRAGRYDPVRVVLFPGVGNPRVDGRTGEVHASIQPADVRNVAIVGTLGELFLHRDAELRESYRRHHEIPRKHETELRASFHRDFIQWVLGDSRGRRGFATRTARWLERYLGRGW